MQQHVGRGPSSERPHEPAVRPQTRVLRGAPAAIAAVQATAGNAAAGRAVLQRLAAINYANGPPQASGTITRGDLGTGTSASVSEYHVPGHMGNSHPYHHERGHLIAKQLGGDGANAQNLVGLSDGTNAPLMADMEGTVADILRAAGAGASVYIETHVDYTGTDYNGPAAAPYIPGMAGSIQVVVYDQPGGDVLFNQKYPNGVVKNHAALGCC